jgi:hypothetical protein
LQAKLVIQKTPDGSYIVAEVSGSTPSFAATSTAHSEQKLRAILKSYGFRDEDIGKSILEVNKGGNTIL